MARPYDGLIFDLDGTIYLGDHLLPGAAEIVAGLRREGVSVVFVSNKPLEPRENYAAKLIKLGIATPPEDVINSTRALVHYLKREHAQARLLVLGEAALLDELGREGFTLCDAVHALDRFDQVSAFDDIDMVVASFDRTLDYDKLNTAHQALMRGARFIATNADATCPVEGGALPDCGGVIAFLEATTGRKVALVAGKPSSLILQAALDRLGVGRQRCLMVGDRLATDMLMGIQAGMDTALVLSGVTTREMLAASDLTPTWVGENVAALWAYLRRAMR